MNRKELEYRLLYSLVVAGKSATFAEGAMKRFLADTGGKGPFEYIRALLPRGLLTQALKEARTGCYGKLAQGFCDAAQANIDLEFSPPELFEMLIHGVGPKTSRFFIIWTRPHARHAAIDTHVLKWLGMLKLTDRRSTPAPVEYARLERLFIAEDDRRGVTPRDLDANIWDWCRGGALKWGEHLDPINWPPELRPAA